MTSEVPDLPGLTDLSLLGRGGLADVYLARQQHLERWIAAKVFRVTLADDQAAERFRAECRAIGRLDQYPHVLTVYDAGVLGDGRPYLISERCDGSLHDLVAMRGPLPSDRVAALGSTIGRALRFAHSAGVLHGDVTPQNLLLRMSGAPVLADFGLAVLRDHAPTAAGFTLLHAAPEALRPGAVIDERADVYGLGSTLYTVLTGTPPFPQRPGEDGDAYRARRHDEPAPRPEGGTDQLAGLLNAMLAVDPAHRPSTDEVIAGLETAPGRGTRSARTGGTLVATNTQPESASASASASASQPAPPARTGRTKRAGRPGAWTTWTTRVTASRTKRDATPRPWDTRVTGRAAAGAGRAAGSGPTAAAAAPGDTGSTGASAVPVADGATPEASGAPTASGLPTASGPPMATAAVAHPAPAAEQSSAPPGPADEPSSAAPADGSAQPAASAVSASSAVPADAVVPADAAPAEPERDAAVSTPTYVPLAPIRSDLPRLLYRSGPPEDAAPPAAGPDRWSAVPGQAAQPATTYVPLAPIRPDVADGLVWPSEPAEAAAPPLGDEGIDGGDHGDHGNHGAHGAHGADHGAHDRAHEGVGADDWDDVAAPVRIPGRRRRRRRSGTALLAAGGATAVLVAGAGATAAWRATDDGVPDRNPARSPSVPPTGAAQPAAPRTAPADLPPAALLPGSTLGAVPPSTSAAPAPPARPAPSVSPQRPPAERTRPCRTRARLVGPPAHGEPGTGEPGTGESPTGESGTEQPGAGRRRGGRTDGPEPLRPTRPAPARQPSADATGPAGPGAGATAGDQLPLTDRRCRAGRKCR